LWSTKKPIHFAAEVASTRSCWKRMDRFLSMDRNDLIQPHWSFFKWYIKNAQSNHNPIFLSSSFWTGSLHWQCAMSASLSPFSWYKRATEVPNNADLSSHQASGAQANSANINIMRSWHRPRIIILLCEQQNSKLRIQHLPYWLWQKVG
jgi:hypothetical protein